MEFFSQLIERELDPSNDEADLILDRRFLISKNNASNPSSNNSEGLMEVSICGWTTTDQKDFYVALAICSSACNHRQGTKEWHDMKWCAQWRVICEL